MQATTFHRQREANRNWDLKVICQERKGTDITGIAPKTVSWKRVEGLYGPLKRASIAKRSLAFRTFQSLKKHIDTFRAESFKLYSKKGPFCEEETLENFGNFLQNGSIFHAASQKQPVNCPEKVHIMFRDRKEGNQMLPKESSQMVKEYLDTQNSQSHFYQVNSVRLGGRGRRERIQVISILDEFDTRVLFVPNTFKDLGASEVLVMHSTINATSVI